MNEPRALPDGAASTERATDGPGRDAARTVADAIQQLALHASPEGAEGVAQLGRQAMLGELPSGRALVEDLADRQKTKELPTVIASLVICLGFCGDAVRAERSGGDRDGAWRAAAAARYWLGVSVGIASSLSESARKHYEAWKNGQQAKEQWVDNVVAKSWARETYQKDKASYRSKADFARTAQRHVKTHYEVDVEWPHIRDNWLKGL